MSHSPFSNLSLTVVYVFTISHNRSEEFQRERIVTKINEQTTKGLIQGDDPLTGMSQRYLVDPRDPRTSTDANQAVHQHQNRWEPSDAWIPGRPCREVTYKNIFYVWSRPELADSFFGPYQKTLTLVHHCNKNIQKCEKRISIFDSMNLKMIIP